MKNVIEKLNEKFGKEVVEKYLSDIGIGSIDEVEGELYFVLNESDCLIDVSEEDEKIFLDFLEELGVEVVC